MGQQYLKAVVNVGWVSFGRTCVAASSSISSKSSSTSSVSVLEEEPAAAVRIAADCSACSFTAASCRLFQRRYAYTMVHAARDTST